MDPQNLESELRACLQERLHEDISGLDLDADLVRNLGMDSLKRLQLLAVLEKHLNVRFPDEQLHKLRTLRQLIEAIQQYRAEKEEVL